MTFEWSPQQAEAIAAMNDWYNKGNKQIFRLFGYAGTGKSTIANELARVAGKNVVYVAYTGKAAIVMQKAGCAGASTIHSVTYKARPSKRTGKPIFSLWRDGPLCDANLIVTDECSMVGEKVAKDLLSFGVPVLALGDPFQLPPVKDAGFFTEHEPDIMLTEIHRQAAGNPIIKLATDVREGRPLIKGTYGLSQVIDKADVAREDVLAADQVLVGLNKTRKAYNKRLRALAGLKSDDGMPIKGDRLVCLRNNAELGIFNGGLFKVKAKTRPASKKCIGLEIQSDDFKNSNVIDVDIRREFFDGDPSKIDYNELYGTSQFDYGYALTVHKSQGSGWPFVMLFDESQSFRDKGQRWLYTGVTRAAKRITIVQ